MAPTPGPVSKSYSQALIVPAAALGSSLKGHGMERERLRALVILGVLSLARGDPPGDDTGYTGASSPFHYDWCHLRVGGLVVAAVLSVLGIAVLFSGKCKCRSKASRRRPPPRAATPVWDRSLRCPQASPELPQSVPNCPQNVPKWS
ncbi:FXYD domain-containing ion transport regulator 4-like [Ammospiza maritima maritima]